MDDVFIKENLQRVFGGKLLSEIKQQEAEKKPSKKPSKNVVKSPRKTSKKAK